MFDRHLASASHFESRTAECSEERRSNFRKNFPDILIGRHLIFGKKVIKLFCFVLFRDTFPNTLLSKVLFERNMLFEPQALLFYKRLFFQI
jgi:hypothetical protein